MAKKKAKPSRSRKTTPKKKRRPAPARRRVAKKTPKRKKPKKTSAKRSGKKTSAKRPKKLKANKRLAKFLRRTFRELAREGYRGKQLVVLALKKARARGFKVKKNPLTIGETAAILRSAREHLVWARKAARRMKKAKGAKARRERGDRDFYSGYAAGEASAAEMGHTTTPSGKRFYPSTTAAIHLRGEAHKVQSGQRAKRDKVSSIVIRAASGEDAKSRYNPAQMLGVTTLLGNPTLAAGMESWAKARGLAVPKAGTPAWSGLYRAWQRAGMPIKNERKRLGDAFVRKHLTAWLKRYRWPEDRTRIAKRILRAVKADPSLLESSSWPDIERATREKPEANPKRSKKRKASRKTSAKRMATPSAAVKKIRRYGDLPAAWKARLRAAALVAARRDRIALADVPIRWGKAAAPFPGGLVDHGDLVAIEYAFRRGEAPRSPFGRDTFRHAAGDNGRGKKKSRPQTLGIDPKTRHPVLVSRRGSRPGFSGERGLSG